VSRGEESDINLVHRALANPGLNGETREVFEEWLIRLESGRIRSLSEKQRTWAKGTLDEPTYENLVSSGRANRGKEVPTPAVLLNRPLKPPRKPASDE
jgi:hypothetical protein